MDTSFFIHKSLVEVDDSEISCLDEQENKDTIAMNSRKNVLLLHTDQQRYDSLGCTGNSHARTANIDKLALEGTVFCRHIASNSACMPSRAGLLTGQYPPGHNVWVNGVALNRKEYLGGRVPDVYAREPLTMADMFAAEGYDTAAFGKLHLTPYLADVSYGYHESIAMWKAGDLCKWHGPYYGFQYVDMAGNHGDVHSVGHYRDWMEHEHPEVLKEREEKLKASPPPIPEVPDLFASPIPSELHSTTWLANRFRSYLERRKNSDKPFFAFVGFPDPHHPFTPSHDIAAQFEDCSVLEPHDPFGEAIRNSLIYQRLFEEKKKIRISMESVTHLTEEQRKLIIRYTYALVHQIDMAVGTIIDTLHEMGEWDNTIIVFTSDHGDFLCDHGLIRKHEIGTDSLMHIPFILRAPGMELPDTVDLPMSNTDVMPTLAALCGITLEGVHGENIVPLVKRNEEHYAFAYNYQHASWIANYTIYDRRYRLTYYPELDYVELFDHQEDPGETNNIALDNRMKNKVEELLDLIGRHTLRWTDPFLGRVAIC